MSPPSLLHFTLIPLHLHPYGPISIHTVITTYRSTSIQPPYPQRSAPWPPPLTVSFPSSFWPPSLFHFTSILPHLHPISSFTSIPLSLSRVMKRSHAIFYWNLPHTVSLCLLFHLSSLSPEVISRWREGLVHIIPEFPIEIDLPARIATSKFCDCFVLYGIWNTSQISI